MYCSSMRNAEECLVSVSHQLGSHQFASITSLFLESYEHTEQKRSRLKRFSRHTPEYPKRFDIPYSDDFNDGFYCHSCEMAQATKKYNRTPCERPGGPFQEIYTDMVEKSSQEECLTRSACSPSATQFLDTHIYTAKTKGE